MPTPRSLVSYLSYKGAGFREKPFLEGFRKALSDEGPETFLGSLRRPVQRDPFVVDTLLEAFGERFPGRRLDAAEAAMSGWVDQPGVTGMASAVERALKKLKAKEREELARWLVVEAKGDWRQGAFSTLQGLYPKETAKVQGEAFKAFGGASGMEVASDELVAEWEVEASGKGARAEEALRSLVMAGTQRALEAIARLCTGATWPRMRDLAADALTRLDSFLDERGRPIPAYSPRGYRGTLVPAGKSPHAVDPVPGPDIPTCPGCRDRLDVVLRLAAKEIRLDLVITGVTHVPVLTCARCSMGELFVRVRGGNVKIVGEPKLTRGPTRPKKHHPQSMELTRIESKDGLGKDAPRHQVGGRPTWITGAHYPICPSCHGNMPFVAQIDSEKKSDCLAFRGGRGLLYAWWCDRCKIVGTDVQA
jgi:hypothetical protein